MEVRPKLKIELNSIDILAEIIGWVVLVSIWVIAISNFQNLPDQIPIHFNAYGQVDSYGSKSTIFMLPIIGTILFIGLTILNNFPHIFNFPVKIHLENAKSQYKNATRLIRFLKLFIVFILLVIVLKTLETTNHKSEGLGIWFLPLFIGLTISLLTIFVVKASRKH